MLVIGGIVDAGREQDDGRVGRGGRRRDRFQRRQQFVRIIFDRRDAIAREQLGKQPQHDLAVFQHVGDARRRARIVLEHIESVGIDAHDIDAGDVDVNIVRHLLTVHLRAEHRILKHQVLGNDAGAQDFAAAIDVLDIGVDRLDALLEAAAQRVPFRCGKNARNDVEGMRRSCASGSPWTAKVMPMRRNKSSASRRRKSSTSGLICPSQSESAA